MELSAVTIKLRVEQLKAMNECILTCNDEELAEGWFMLCVPDNPAEEDFEDIAKDTEAWEMCKKYFKRTINNEDFYM